MNDQIQVFVTGGTFDKDYNYITGDLYFKNTHLPAMFERGRCTLDIDVKTLMMIDSLQMTDEDRTFIANECIETTSNHILLTHGTDSMVETGEFLAKLNIGKTIVITGAMIPYAFGTSSDGFFNLGAALAYLQVMPIGVYIAMNGRIFNYNQVRKNRATGFFEQL